MNACSRISLACVLSVGMCTSAAAADRPDAYLRAVRTFADNVLAFGRDTHGPKKTPLFVDGLNVETRKPPVWRRGGDLERHVRAE